MHFAYMSFLFMISEIPPDFRYHKKPSGQDSFLLQIFFGLQFMMLREQEDDRRGGAYGISGAIFDWHRPVYGCLCRIHLQGPEDETGPQRPLSGNCTVFRRLPGIDAPGGVAFGEAV